MEKASSKDFFREILKNKGRFISIVFIVMLGTAFFAGLRSTSYDMKYSADIYYDDAKLMDIRVLGTMGIGEEDVEDISAISGVDYAVGSYSVDAICTAREDQFTIKVIAACKKMNQPVLVEGRMPKNPGECLVDAGKSFGHGVKIGETISLSSGTTDDLGESLTDTELKVVGRGYLPYYIDLERGTTSIGDGSLDTFIVVPEDTFSLDYYTVCYVRVKDAEKLNCHSDEYKDLIDSVKENIEAISDAASLRRFEKFRDEAKEQIEDAKKEIADGEKELRDAAEKIEDGKKKITEAEDEIAENEKKLLDAEKEIESNEALLIRSEEEIKMGREQLLLGEEELNKNKELFEKSEEEYQKGLAEYEAGYAEYDAGYQKYLAGKEKYESGYAEYEEGLRQYEERLAGYVAVGMEELGRWLLSGIKNRLDRAKETLDAAETELRQAEEELEAARIPIDEGKAKLDAAAVELEAGREKLLAGEKEFEEKKTLLENGEAEVRSGRSKLEAGKRELEDGKEQLEAGKKELEEKKQELIDAEKKYDEEYPKAVKDIEKAKRDIRKAEDKIEKMELPEWYVLGRDSIESYVSYEQNADRMENLGKVFPVIFFLVAALVSLTAMTRMVEEQRMQIGTMKALGYANHVIAGRYFWYAILATLIGSVMGISLGEWFLPYIISTSYGILYTGMNVYKTPINWDQALLAVLAATLSTGLATLAASLVQLRAKPAELMRPEAPKGGKRVFLERMGFIWNHLKFSHKATVRNLLRYKKRFIMTVIGVGGCMGLLLVGFGLIDSITEIAKEQYIHIFTYQANITLDSEAYDEEVKEVYDFLEAEDDVTGMLRISMSGVTLKYNGNERDANLFVPESLDIIDDMLVLRDRKSRERYSFPTEGAAISEKTAEMLGASVGDIISIYTDETTHVEVAVTRIVENYVMHYIFISADTYQTLFKKEAAFDNLLINYDTEKVDEDDLGRRVLQLDGCKGFSSITSLELQIDDMLGVLNRVMWVLIISAGLLAFVVLYNLNSINITERKRELATLKVLGFFDGEVSMYVFRENIILTLFGTLVGFVFGTYLHRFTVTTVEVDVMMFGRLISLQSYIYAALITMAFSIFVNIVMDKDLRRINMIESLKSVE